MADAKIESVLMVDDGRFAEAACCVRFEQVSVFKQLKFRSVKRTAHDKCRVFFRWHSDVGWNQQRAVWIFMDLRTACAAVEEAVRHVEQTIWRPCIVFCVEDAP